MNMPKEIGNCLCCDAILWNDGVSTKGGNKSYGGNQEYCGDCLQDEKIYELEDEVKKLQKENKKLRLQLGTSTIEESYDTDKDFVWATKELLEGRTVRRHKWSNVKSKDSLIWVGSYIILSRESEKEISSDDENIARHVKTILVRDHFKKLTVTGVVDMGWLPTAEDMVANDWGPGFPDMKKIEAKLLSDKKK